MSPAFYIAGAIAVVATVGVVSSRDAVHAVVWMIASLLAVAAVFASMGAMLAAVLEAIVYAGAIMVLFIFAILLMGTGGRGRVEVDAFRDWRPWVAPVSMGVTALSLLGLILVRGGAPLDRGLEVSSAPAPSAVADGLYGDYLLAVELVSLLLLAAMVAVVHLVRRERST